MWKRIAPLLGVCLLLAAPAYSQSSLRQVPIPNSFCSLSGMVTATNLSSCTVGMAANPPATYLVICAYTQGVVWRDDTVAPTSTPGVGGQGIVANQCIPYNGTPSALQFIQQASGAVLGVSFYR